MIVIRCAADAATGLGHLARSRVLARQLVAAGEVCALVGPPRSLRRTGDDALFASWTERPGWSSAAEEAAFHVATCERLGATSLVVDDYRSDFEHQLRLRRAGLLVLQQFDASRPQRFAAHVIVNAGPGTTRSAYEARLLEPEIDVLLGPDFAILAPRFAELRPSAPRRDVQRLLVSFGGGDDRGAVTTVLRALAGHLPSRLRTVVVVGALSPRVDEIGAWIAAHPAAGIDLHVDPVDMPELIASCDAAVLAGGTTSYEAAACGLPMVLMPIAPNQVPQAAGWAQLGAAIDLGALGTVAPATIAAAVSELVARQDLAARMSAAALAAVDGGGAERIALRTLALARRSHDPLS